MDSCVVADDVPETENKIPDQSNFHRILIDQSTEMDLNITHQQPASSNTNTSQQTLSSSINDELHWYRVMDIYHATW